MKVDRAKTIRRINFRMIAFAYKFCKNHHITEPDYFSDEPEVPLHRELTRSEIFELVNSLSEFIMEQATSMYNHFYDDKGKRKYLDGFHNDYGCPIRCKCQKVITRNNIRDYSEIITYNLHNKIMEKM